MTTAAVAKSKRDALERQYSKIVDCLSAFNAEVPNEDSARARVFAGLVENRGIECPHCRGVGMPGSERSFGCRKCKRIVWVTAGSFFENVRKMRPWLAMIWLFEHGVEFNPSQVCQSIGVSTSTAAEIKKKLDFLIASQMPADSPTVPSGLFADVFCRRTIETPARAHPREEQLEVDRKADKALDTAPDVVPLDPEDPFSGPLNDYEQAIWDCLSDEFISFDRLVVLSQLPVSLLNSGIFLLRMRGLIKAQFETFARVPKSSRFKVDKNSVPFTGFVSFIKTVHQGIGRRMLQLHLAAFWCFIDRTRWGPGKLLSICLNSHPVSRHQLRTYVSPQFVKILPRLS